MFALASSKLPFLLCGAVGGYLLLLCTSPVRSSLRDGLRALRRYSTLWFTLGAFGCCYAIFQLAVRAYFYNVSGPGVRPVFLWARAAWQDEKLWLTGSPESLWHLPRADFLAVLRDACLPTLDSVAGVFNNLVTTFPVSALAAVLLLVNWDGHHGVLVTALRKRFGVAGWLVHLAILVCAFAAIAKPFIYAVPQLIQPEAHLVWFQWAPVLAWLSFLFEYLFGVCIQIYLILLAYAWVRGISFTHAALLDVAIRRFSYVVKWAALVMLLSTLLIDAPLILKNFPQTASWFPPEKNIFDERLTIARALLAGFLLLTASMQITLTFHSESWRQALREHLKFVRRNWPAFGWYLVLAALHFYALHVCDLSVRRGVGEGTALWVAWTLLFPWIAALVAAWMLASWVCVFKRCDHRRALTDDSVRF